MGKGGGADIDIHVYCVVFLYSLNEVGTLLLVQVHCAQDLAVLIIQNLNL